MINGKKKMKKKIILLSIPLLFINQELTSYALSIAQSIENYRRHHGGGIADEKHGNKSYQENKNNSELKQTGNQDHYTNMIKEIEHRLIEQQNKQHDQLLKEIQKMKNNSKRPDEEEFQSKKTAFFPSNLSENKRIQTNSNQKDSSSNNSQSISQSSSEDQNSESNYVRKTSSDEDVERKITELVDKRYYEMKKSGFSQCNQSQSNNKLNESSQLTKGNLKKLVKETSQKNKPSPIPYSFGASLTSENNSQSDSISEKQSSEKSAKTSRF